MNGTNCQMIVLMLLVNMFIIGKYLIMAAYT